MPISDDRSSLSDRSPSGFYAGESTNILLDHRSNRYHNCGSMDGPHQLSWLAIGWLGFGRGKENIVIIPWVAA